MKSALLGVGLLLAADVAAGQGVAGRVLDAETQAAVAGVRVLLVTLTDSVLTDAVTDRNGGPELAAESQLSDRFAMNAVATGLLACSDSTAPSCDVCITSGLVYGSVTDAGGVPVTGVPVDIRVYADACPAQALRGGTDSLVPRTDAGGLYRGRVLSLWSPFSAQCFVITINPGDDSRWPSGSFERSGPLMFRPDHDGSPRDSIRFDVTVSTP